MTTGNQLIARFEKFANPQLAEKWDHVGLQIGNPDLPITRLSKRSRYAGSAKCNVR